MAIVITSATERGFTVITFTDSYDNQCSLQKSSLATDDAIWLGLDDANPKIMACHAFANGVETKKTAGWVPYPIPEDVLIHTRMHLTRGQVAALLPLLQHFVTTGELP